MRAPRPWVSGAALRRLGERRRVLGDGLGELGLRQGFGAWGSSLG